MRTPRLLLAAAALCLLCFQSCKKSDPAPTPVPTIKPDTLGVGWSKQVLAGETNFADIFFNSSTTGYLVGSKIYKSADGGYTWSQVSTNSSLNNIFMTNDSKAFFTGAGNSILKTIDGGSTFVNTFLGGFTSDVFFTDNNNGFCITGVGLRNTTDGGLTWQNITTSGLGFLSSYGSLSFINNTTGWIVNESGIFRSVGSLTNWQPSVVNGGSSGSNFKAVYAVSASIIYSTNNFGEIFKSTDGGANFNFIKKLEDGGFADIQFLTDQIGYANSGRSIYKTTDAGTNWSKVVSLGENSITEIHFTDATHGWACGSNGTVLIFK